jgi:O-antigen ligase
LLLLAPFSEQFLELIYGAGEDSKAVTEGVQNALRNANAYSVILPILASFLWTRGGPRWITASCALWVFSFGAFLILGTQAAMFGVAFALAFIALVHLRPQNGFKWLMGGIAGYIALAPLLLGGGAYLAGKLNISVPGSFQSRLWSWDVVTGKILERPLTGHGLSASKTWRETYADHPDWLAELPAFWASYPVVPGHPHNMPLQIWAETGAIGAGLAALAVLLLGWRLPAPADLPPLVRYAAAGMIGAGLTLFSFAYSAWNEAFWAMIVLAVLALILLYRQHRGQQSA